MRKIGVLGIKKIIGPRPLDPLVSLRTDTQQRFTLHFTQLKNARSKLRWWEITVSPALLTWFYIVKIWSSLLYALKQRQQKLLNKVLKFLDPRRWPSCYDCEIPILKVYCQNVPLTKKRTPTESLVDTIKFLDLIENVVYVIWMILKTNFTLIININHKEI